MNFIQIFLGNHRCAKTTNFSLNPIKMRGEGQGVRERLRGCTCTIDLSLLCILCPSGYNTGQSEVVRYSYGFSYSCFRVWLQ